jgi:tRNA pseudouridine38-40 synthase
MPRYFIELSYKGTKYSGFQIQENAVTIQSEVEKAFETLHRRPVTLTGSSRTDTGVHAFQNFFHFDFEDEVNPQFVYKMNAILPRDISIRNIYGMPAEAHARFDALSRQYVYRIHRFKDPFLNSTSFYYPYKLDFDLVTKGAEIIKGESNFFAFSKTNTQVKNFNCQIIESSWKIDEDQMEFTIEANRFLRGMVRLLTASLLKLGRGKLPLDEFVELFRGERKCGYSVPPHGLFLKTVRYRENYFPATDGLFTAV